MARAQTSLRSLRKLDCAAVRTRRLAPMPDRVGTARVTVLARSTLGARAFAHPTEVPIHVSAPLARNSSSQWM